MCGIAGIVDGEHRMKYRNQQAVEDMLDTMKRRGPDQQNIYTDEAVTLLHARLSVMDLQHGKQPMQLKSDPRYVMVYNGELYNTEELRRELQKKGYAFQETSDTEVLLQAFIEWKEAVVERLNGIFAFAVWDKKAHRLFMARDRMGVKPLFYTLQEGAMLFASEMKALLAHPQIPAILHAGGIAEIMLLGPGRTPGYGVFHNIRELKPGQYAWYDHKGMRLTTYFHLQDREHPDDFATTVQTVHDLVTDSIRRQLIADVDVATFLSGGLDSSIISAVAAREFKKQGKTLHTFSVNYEDNEKYFHSTKFQPNSDQHYIEVMQGFLQSDHHDIVLKTEDLVDALYTAVDARDLPGMADVDSSLLLFCKEIRKYCTVALSGECADEIFGGYPWYRDPKIRATYGFPWAQSTKYRMGFLNEELAEQINAVTYVDQRYQETLKQSDILCNRTKEERRLREMVNLNMKWFMQTLLDRKDRMSMYNSLEVRVPFCDMRIAEYLYSVPWEFKDYQGYEKGLLREAVKGLLPDEVLWRKKSPYPKTWHPKYRELVSRQMEELLAQGNEPLMQLVKREKLQELLREDRSIPWYGQLMNTPQTIAYLLQVNYWLKKYHVQIQV